MGRPKKEEEIVEDSEEKTEKKKKKADQYYLTADYILDRNKVVIPVSPAIDSILSNKGVPEGSLVILSGASGLGKTTYALRIGGNAQKLGKQLIYVNVESRLRSSTFEGVEGLDLSPDKLKIISSTPGKILSAEEFLMNTERAMLEFENSIIIIDSLSALVSADGLTKNIGEGFNLASRKVEGEFISRTAAIRSINGSIIIVIAHVNIGIGTYAGTTEKMAKSTGYSADIKLRMTKAQPFEILAGDKLVGHRLKFEVLKNSLGPPGGEAIGYLRYGTGPDDISELIEIAESLGVIIKGGSWYNIGDEKLQGFENVRSYLQNNNDKYLEILNKVNEIIGD